MKCDRGLAVILEIDPLMETIQSMWHQTSRTQGLRK